MAKEKPVRKSASGKDAAVPDMERVAVVIEMELRRLQKAAAVLAGLSFALVYARDRTNDEVNQMGSGDFADMAETACDLVRQSVRNLDAATAPGSSKTVVAPKTTGTDEI